MMQHAACELEARKSECQRLTVQPDCVKGWIMRGTVYGGTHYGYLP